MYMQPWFYMLGAKKNRLIEVKSGSSLFTILSVSFFGVIR